MRLVLAAASWVMLIAAVLLTAFLAGWVLLGSLRLHGAQLPVVVALVVLMGATVGTAWLVARFGQLFVNNGNWNGRQVISQEWVEEPTAPITNDQRPYSPAGAAAWKAANGYAKYLWWGKIRAGGSYDYMAWGAQGEFIFLSLKARVVVVRFGIDEGAVGSWPDVFEDVIAKLGRLI